jgi:paraquat-inducible protein B
MPITMDRRLSGPEPAPPPPEVVVKRRRGPSVIWIIPIVAALIGLYLAWLSYAERGPVITIAFTTAAGLEPGKTKVKYKDVEVGTVEHVQLSDDLHHIVVTAQMDKGVASRMNDGTRFWVVRPRIGAGGVSGLDTLVSGAFIEMDPGKGQFTTAFTGLEVPPLVSQDVPGKSFVLHADNLGSITRGAPVHYRGIEVGQVLGYELGKGDEDLTIHVFVNAPYDRLVRENSRFWNASGIRVSTGAQGLQVQMESLQSVIMGGVDFDSPATPEPVVEARADSTFRLFDSFSAVTDATYTEKELFVAYFDGSVRGLEPGAPVEIRGLRVGTVTNVRLTFDPATNHIQVPVTFEFEPERIAGGEADGALVDRTPAAVRQRIEKLVDRGFRAQLQTGSLITGDLLVNLDFFPDAPKAELGTEGDALVMPTVPTQLDTLSASLTAVLNNVSSLPLNELVFDLRQTVQGVDKLVSSPDAANSVKTLNTTMAQLETLFTKLDTQIDPVATSLRQTLDDANGAIRAARSTFASTGDLLGSDSKFRYDVASLLKELSTAARSIRVFADYLERHPEALIRGKGDSSR